MLAETLAATAAAMGTAVVQAAGTDFWAGFRRRCARLVGRGDPQRENAALERLDQTAALLEAADDEGERDRQEAVWQARFETLLENLDQREGDQVVAELRALVAEVHAVLPQERAGWTQTNIARDNSRLFAVQGGNVIYHEAAPRLASEGDESTAPDPR
ncbi:hypothetical protein ACFV80_45290 [Streptomyces sp. NPDC059862]|uniref:hypothetical protein n=1 Tax=Streptomyces sp. NPDC059862 TaxID=3346975 RepID=UPI003658C149